MFLYYDWEANLAFLPFCHPYIGPTLTHTTDRHQVTRTFRAVWPNVNTVHVRFNARGFPVSRSPEVIANIVHDLFGDLAHRPRLLAVAPTEPKHQEAQFADHSRVAADQVDLRRDLPPFVVALVPGHGLSPTRHFARD